MSDARLTATEKIVLSVLVFSALVMFLNETILSVALTPIMEDLSIPATTAQWLTTGFMLTMAVVIPTTGFLLERLHTRTIFFAALISFIAGTVVAALSPAFLVLLVGRVLQAMGTAIIMPLLMTVTMRVVPAERRGSVMGIISVVIAVAPALGPTVSGVILNVLSWHWLFWVMVPLSALALVIGAVFLRNVGETSEAHLDVVSVILSAFGFGGVIYAVSELSSIISGSGMARWSAVAAGVVGIAALVLFARRQLRLEHPVLNMAVFGVANFRLCLIVMITLFGGLIGAVTVLPIFMQSGVGLDPRTTGLVLMPGGLINGFVAPFIGRLYDRFGPRPLLIPGMVLFTVGMVLMATTMNEDTSAWGVVARHVLFSIGLGLSITPLMTTALGSLTDELYGHGSAAFNTLQQLGGALGTALLVMALNMGTMAAQNGGAAASEAVATGTQVAFLVGTVFAVLALILAPRVRPVGQHAAS